MGTSFNVLPKLPIAILHAATIYAFSMIPPKLFNLAPLQSGFDSGEHEGAHNAHRSANHRRK